MTTDETTLGAAGETAGLSRLWVAVFLAIGLACGFAIYLIFDQVTSPAWEFGPSIGLLAGAAVFCLAVDPRRWWPAAAAAAALAALLALLTTSTMLQFEEGLNDIWYLRDLGLVLQAIILATIALPFLQCWQETGRASFPYPRLFTFAWNNWLILILADVFTGFFWLIIFLFAQLFLAVGIDFLDELMHEPVFYWPATTAVGALGLYAGRDYHRVIIALRRIVLTLFSVLTPVFLGLSLVFVAILLFGGFEKLSSVFSAAGTLATLMVIGVILFNALLRDGGDEAPANRLFSLCAMLMAPAMLVLAGYAAYAVYLRIDQYGLTPERIWIAVAVFVLGLHALAYTASLATRQHWREWSRKANVRISVLVALLAVALLTPWGDPYHLSAENQYDRLASGTADPQTFDYGFLKFELGAHGRDILARIAEDSGTADRDIVEARLAALAKAKDRWEWRSDALGRRAAQAAPVMQDPQRVRRIPADLEVPADIGPGHLYSIIESCGEAPKKPCLITAVDVTDAPGEEFLLAMRQSESYLNIYLIERGDEGSGWKSSFVSAEAEEGDLWTLLENGALQTVPADHQDLKIGDSVIRLRLPSIAGVSLLAE